MFWHPWCKERLKQLCSRNLLHKKLRKSFHGRASTMRISMPFWQSINDSLCQCSKEQLWCSTSHVSYTFDTNLLNIIYEWKWVWTSWASTNDSLSTLYRSIMVFNNCIVTLFVGNSLVRTESSNTVTTTHAVLHSEYYRILVCWTGCVLLVVPHGWGRFTKVFKLCVVYCQQRFGYVFVDKYNTPFLSFPFLARDSVLYTTLGI